VKTVVLDDEAIHDLELMRLAAQRLVAACEAVLASPTEHNLDLRAGTFAVLMEVEYRRRDRVEPGWDDDIPAGPVPQKERLGSK
jgi:hypothetical protein